MQFFVCKWIALSCILKLILNYIFINFSKFMHIFYNISEFLLMMMLNIFIFIEIFWWFWRRGWGRGWLTSTWRLSLFIIFFIWIALTSASTLILSIFFFFIFAYIFTFLFGGRMRTWTATSWIRRRISGLFFVFTFWHF